MPRLITSILFLLLFFDSVYSNRKKDFPLQTEGIKYRYNEQRQLEIDLQSMAQSHYLRVETMHLVRQAVKQFINKGSFERVAVFFHSFRFFPCELSSEKLTCRNEKEKALKYFRRSRLKYGRRLIDALNKHDYALYTTRGRYYFKQLVFNITLSFAEPVDWQRIEKKIFVSKFSDIRYYRFEHQKARGQIYLEVVKQFDFEGVAGYGRRWAARLNRKDWPGPNAKQFSMAVKGKNRGFQALRDKEEKNTWLLAMAAQRGFLLTFSELEPEVEIGNY